MAQAAHVIQEAPKNRRGLSINFCIAVRVRGEFSLEGLQTALDHVRGRHKLLISNDAHFTLRCVTSDDDNAWKEIVIEELGSAFLDNTGAFARFTWLRSKDYSELIGTFHHRVCDGFSGIYVMRDVLQFLGNPSTPLSPFSAPPHISKLIPESVAASKFVKQRLHKIVMMTRLHLWIQHLRARFITKPQAIPVQANLSASGVLPPNLRMCILTKSLTESQTTQLVQRCTAEHTTVHAAICTAWLRAFVDSLPARATRIRSVSSPISLRNRLIQQIDETTGTFLSIVETSLDCTSGRNFWDMAREFQSRFKCDTTDEKLFMMPLKFGAFAKAFSNAEMSEAVPYIFAHPVKYDFSITNLGRLDFPTQIGPLHIESVRNLVNSTEEERTVGVNTFDGKMNFIFMFRESKMAPDEGERLMAEALLQLEKATDW